MQAISLELESLSPMYDEYTFRDDADVEDPTRFYDGLVTAILNAESSKMITPYLDTLAQGYSIPFGDSRCTANAKSQFDSVPASLEIALLTWSFADTTLVREKGKYGYGSTLRLKDSGYPTVTTEDGELMNMMTSGDGYCSKRTRVHSWLLQFTRNSNSQKRVDSHSENTPSDMAEEHYCKPNTNKLVYRGVSNDPGIQYLIGYETACWPTTCLILNFIMEATHVSQHLKILLSMAMSITSSDIAASTALLMCALSMLSTDGSSLRRAARATG